MDTQYRGYREYEGQTDDEIIAAEAVRRAADQAARTIIAESVRRVRRSPDWGQYAAAPPVYCEHRPCSSCGRDMPGRTLPRVWYRGRSLDLLLCMRCSDAILGSRMRD